MLEFATTLNIDPNSIKPTVRIYKLITISDLFSANGF